MDIREKEILEILTKKKFIRSAKLSELLHCSTSSIRRALIQLENKNLIVRMHGGVSLVQDSNVEFAYTYREETNITKKREIVQIAQEFIGTGMCLFLDSSSTVQQLIPFLIKIPNLVIITNSLKTASLLSESNNESLKVFIVGGEIKMNTNSVIPSNQDPIFDSFRYDLAFFSCRGIDEEGIYEANFSQANLKKEMMHRAKQKILLVDDSKFGSTHFFKIGNYSDYDAFITNQEPDAIYATLIEQSGSELLFPTRD